MTARSGLAYRLEAVPESPVTVVFENALICSTTEWAWMREHLRGRLSTLAYDRAGIGDSVRPAVRLDAAAQVGRLRALLDRLAVSPPYVLVGHSVGGLLVRSFAHRHPDEMAGLVLVDSSDPHQVPGPDDYDALRNHIDLAHRLVMGGTLAAARRYGRFDSVLTGLPEDERELAARQLRRPGMCFAAAAELRAYRRNWCGDAARWTGGSGETVFVSAGRTLIHNPRHKRRQQTMIDSVAGARHVVIPDADHESVVADRRHAVRVAELILEIAAGVRPAGNPALIAGSAS